MAVALDVTGHIDTGASTTATSLSGTPVTIGSGSNRAIGVFLGFGGSNALPTGITVTVGGVSAAAVTGASVLGGGGVTISGLWFALVNPASGAQTIAAAWTGGRSCIMQAITATGVNQTGGATSFAHGTSNSLAPLVATSSITITSATGNMTAAAFLDDGATGFASTSATQDAIFSPTAGNISGAFNHTAGSASNVMTATYSGTDATTNAGFDFVAAAGAATPVWVPNAEPNHSAAISSHTKAVAVALAASAGLVWVPRPIPVTPNTTPARWYQPLSIPLPVAKAQLGSFFVPFNTSQITVGAPKGWQSIASAAPAVAKVNASALTFVVPPFPVPNGWQSTSAPAAPVASARPGSTFVPFDTRQTNTATIDKWQQPLSIPILSPPVQLGAAFVPFNTLQINTAPLGWYRALAATPPATPAQQGSASLSFNIAPTINTISGMGWYQALAVTPPAPLAQIGATFVPFNTPQVVTSISSYGWYQPLSIAPLVATAVYTQPIWIPTPFPALTMAWQQPLSGAVSAPAAQQGSVSLSFNIPPLANNIPAGGWRQPLSVAVSVAIAQAGYTFVPFNTVQLTPTTIKIVHNLPFHVTVGKLKSF